MRVRRVPPSLERRLAVRLTLLLVGVVGLSFAVFVYQSYITVSDLRERSLQAQAREIAAHLAVAPDGSARVTLPPDAEALYANSANAYFHAVYGAGDRLEAASSAAFARRFASSIPGGTGARFFRIDTATPDGPYYGYVTGARGFRIVVAQGHVNREALTQSLLEEFIEYIVWWTVPLIAAAVWFAVATVRSGLRPVEALSRRAAALSLETVDIRLPEDDLPREILPLVRAFNEALDRLDSGLDLHRRFIADVAHQLRTPVAVLRARLESTDGESLTPDSLRGDVLRLDRLVGQLLHMARLDATRATLRDGVELNRLARTTIADIAPLAVREGREIGLDGTDRPVTVRGDASMLAEALSNLIDNVLRHTPRGTPVGVRIDPAGAIEVMDRGPGVPPEHRRAIFDRFGRPPGRTANGAGLGLAIVAEIARLHDGSVEVADRAGGGAVFRLTVPLAGENPAPA